MILWSTLILIVLLIVYFTKKKSPNSVVEKDGQELEVMPPAYRATFQFRGNINSASWDKYCNAKDFSGIEEGQGNPPLNLNPFYEIFELILIDGSHCMARIDKKPDSKEGEANWISIEGKILQPKEVLGWKTTNDFTPIHPPTIEYFNKPAD